MVNVDYNDKYIKLFRNEVKKIFREIKTGQQKSHPDYAILIFIIIAYLI